MYRINIYKKLLNTKDKRKIEYFSKDHSSYIKCIIAENPNITQKAIANLLVNYDERVIRALCKNPSISQEMKDMIFIRTGVKNPNC